MAKKKTTESLDLKCGIDLKMVKNGVKGDEFPYRYYAILTPNDDSFSPIDVELPLELYQKLIDKSSGKGHGKVTADFTRYKGKVTIEICVE